MEEIINEKIVLDLNKGNIFYNLCLFLLNLNKQISENDIYLVVKIVLHGSGALHHIIVCLYGIYMDLTHYDHSLMKDIREYGPAFLTGWNITFQTIYLVIALLHDGMEWRNRGKTGFVTKLKYWKDIVFTGLVFPVTCFVSGMFWSLYSIDRELVFPSIYDDVVPWWFNHCVHTNILILVAMETILEPRTKPIDRKLETTLIWSVNICYTAIYYSVKIFANRWLYHIFAILNWWQLILYQLLIWFSAYFFYWLQYPLNRLIHGRSRKTDARIKTDEKNVDEVDCKTECDMKPINLKYRL